MTDLNRSNNIYRSAAALATLIHASVREGYYTAPIFAGISAVEPIFHLETLAGTLDDTNPDKKPFLSLVKLGRLANIFAGSPERAPLSATIEQLDTLLLEYRFVPFSGVLTIY